MSNTSFEGILPPKFKQGEWVLYKRTLSVVKIIKRNYIDSNNSENWFFKSSSGELEVIPTNPEGFWLYVATSKGRNGIYIDGKHGIEENFISISEVKDIIANHEGEGTIELLKDLIVHMKVHSNYPDCGYDQMTTEQKNFYDSIWNEHNDKMDAEEKQ